MAVYDKDRVSYSDTRLDMPVLRREETCKPLLGNVPGKLIFTSIQYRKRISLQVLSIY